MSRQPITMPALSDTMETGRLVNWLKHPGEPVKKGEPIAEVETDKAVLELEALGDGYLQGPLAAAGTELPVGATIGWLADRPGEQAESAPAPAPAPPPAGSAREPALPPRVHPRQERATGSRQPVSPYARALARELGLDPERIAPGPDGRVRAAQVVAAALAQATPDLDAGPAWKLEPLTPMQRAVAEGMRATLGTPTFRVSARLSLAPLKELAEANRLSLTLLLARACARVVQQHPRFNAAYTPAGLAQRQRVDVGVAVDLPDGLLTPVLRDVAEQPLEALSAQWRTLKEKARQRRLKPEEYSGATFYLSNLGVFPRVSRFDAILPLGAAAILALGAAHQGVAEFTLSCDHRVVYGADAGRFLQTLAGLVESPEGLLR